MDDPTAIRVKLIPCHTLTAAIKVIFHTMYDRWPRGIRTLFLSINYKAFPASIQYAIDINQTSSCDYMRLRDMFALPLSYIKCLSTLENEKEAL